jgi:hypothetical protein
MHRVCEEALRRERSVKLGCKAQSRMFRFALVAEIECSARCARSQSSHSTRRIPRHFAKPQCRGKTYKRKTFSVRLNNPLLEVSSNGKLRANRNRRRWISACYQERVERATSEPPHPPFRRPLPSPPPLWPADPLLNRRAPASTGVRSEYDSSPYDLGGDDDHGNDSGLGRDSRFQASLC